MEKSNVSIFQKFSFLHFKGKIKTYKQYQGWIIPLRLQYVQYHKHPKQYTRLMIWNIWDNKQLRDYES